MILTSVRVSRLPRPRTLLARFLPDPTRLTASISSRSLTPMTIRPGVVEDNCFALEQPLLVFLLLRRAPATGPVVNGCALPELGLPLHRLGAKFVMWRTPLVVLVEFLKARWSDEKNPMSAARVSP